MQRAYYKLVISVVYAPTAFCQCMRRTLPILSVIAGMRLMARGYTFTQ